MSITAKELYDATMRGEGPLAKHANANPDMPVFLLLGQDNLAAQLVEMWAIQASVMVPSADDKGHTLDKKVTEARQIADEMHHWPIKKNPD